MRLPVGHTKAVRAVAYFPDGRLASGRDDRTVRVWDAAGECVAVRAAPGVVYRSRAARTAGRSRTPGGPAGGTRPGP